MTRLRSAGVGFALGLGLLMVSPLARAADAAAPVEAAPPESRRPQGFAIEPFRNVRGIRALSHLSHGLPAIIAERLGNTPWVRFETFPELFPLVPPVAAAYRIGGAFERGADWKLNVTVEVRASAAPEVVIARAVRTGNPNDAAAMAVEAAVEAFAAVPAIALPVAEVDKTTTARFARDPYAFVLYGRAWGSFVGTGPAPARLERARKVAMKSLVIDPRVPETRRLLGEVHLQGGRPGHARAAFSSALELRGDYVAALRSMAAIDRSNGVPSARESYAQAVTLDPFDLPARRALGELLAEAGQLAEAQAELEKVLAAKPDDVETHRSLVLVLAARQAGPALVAALEDVVRLEPDNIDLRMDLGAAYLSMGRLAEAASTYEDVLRRRPRNTSALKLAADLARERGDVAQASALYTKMRMLAPTDPRPLMLLAATHANAGNVDVAERFYSEGLAFPAVRAEALGNLGALALRRGDTTAALGHLERAAKLRPDRAIIRYNHAMALHRLGRHTEALGELRTAETLDPQDAAVRFLAGVVALRLGLLDEAAASFRAALVIDPRHDDAKHNLAVLDGMGLGREGVMSFTSVEGTQGPIFL
ncbi:MAG TPA: tetratricopeptide repeat protein, partial [Polyangia bacterium]